MKQPNDNDFELAREYLRLRIAAELSMGACVELSMQEAAKRIIELCYSTHTDRLTTYERMPAKLQQQIDDVISWLEAAIHDNFITCAIPEHDGNNDEVLPFVFGENHGLTFVERLRLYCKNFIDELIVLIGAGLLLRIEKNTLAKSIGDNMKRPYNNALIAEAITSPLSYGRGRTNSMFTAISNLTRFGVAQAWMFNRHINAKNQGATSFITFRNSTYPCRQCDSYAETEHSIDEPPPPLHLSCVCGTLYLDANSIPINF